MFRVLLAVALLLPGVALSSASANAQECKPVSYLGAFPISLSKNGDLKTVALLNKVPTTAVLVAGNQNFLPHETVQQLGLEEHPSGSRMFASNGEVSTTYVLVPDFSIGPVAGKNVLFTVFGRGEDAAVAVSLGTFANYDLDFDLYSGRLNLFSPDHCEGKVTYFSTPGVAAIPYAGDFQIPVVLDGHATRAELFGDMLESTMGLAEAKELFGLAPDSPNMEPVRKGEVLVGYRHVFPTFSFGGVSVKNTAFVIIPEKIYQMFKEEPTGSHIAVSPFKGARIGMRVGQNVLKQLHVYIATKEHKLYISPADGAAAKVLPPLKPANAQ